MPERADQAEHDELKDDFRSFEVVTAASILDEKTDDIWRIFFHMLR